MDLKPELIPDEGMTPQPNGSNEIVSLSWEKQLTPRATQPAGAEGSSVNRSEKKSMWVQGLRTPRRLITQALALLIMPCEQADSAESRRMAGLMPLASERFKGLCTVVG